ncbi:hypothetical protein BB934_21465 [Microvirga ossetica]|uniref:Calx-beta domain-containing protein n=1 Tax=Microvirga ossetica TaxID=1882682 RepID=A0A1B2EKI7_9HYPH|nr:hypothetical protein [Microvirga ossetica]ANY80486.1 hypothetical protein BB934_21465 [Microvirga ossetica]
MTLVTGTSGNDVLKGGAGNDTINGGDGSDDIYDGAGDDVVDGGAGNDFIMSSSYSASNPGSGADIFRGGAGSDNIDVARNSAVETLVQIETGSAEAIEGVPGENYVQYSGGAKDSVRVTGGDDRDVVELNGSLKSAVLNLGAGNDTVRISTEANYNYDPVTGTETETVPQISITTGAGRDTIEFASYASATLEVTDFTAGAGGDTLQFGSFLNSRLQNWDGSTNPFATGHLRLVQVGANTVLEYVSDGIGATPVWATLATFRNTSTTSFTADNFEPSYAPDGSHPGAEPISIVTIMGPSGLVEEGTFLEFTLTRSGDLADALTVALSINAQMSGATSGIDFSAPQTVTFAAGSATAVIKIAANLDDQFERNESFTLSVASGPGYTIGFPSAAVGTITEPTNSVTGGVLTTGIDVLSPSDEDTIVNATAGTLNARPQMAPDVPADSLDGGAGYDVLKLSGAGQFDLNGLGQFAGFEEVQLTNASQSPAQLYLRDGQNLKVVLNDGTTVPPEFPTTVGFTVYLSTGAETVSGSNGSDIFSVQQNPAKLGTGDVLDGGAGSDALQLFSSTIWDPVKQTYSDSVYDLRVRISRIVSAHFVGS